MAVFTLGQNPNGCLRGVPMPPATTARCSLAGSIFQIGRIYTRRLPGKGIQRGGLCARPQLGRGNRCYRNRPHETLCMGEVLQGIGKRKETGTGQKKRVKRRTKPKGLNPQAQFWRNMALTKKKKLHIRIPQRQFMGESEELNSRIREKVDQEITNILNS